MHHLFRNVLVVVTSVACSFVADPASAAMSPGTIKKMKEKATDVLGVTVTKASVNSVLKLGYIRKEIVYEAVVTGVKRSASGTAKNARISIQSYHLVGGLLPPGPANPPMLRKGWTGTIHLNKLDNSKKLFRIAVHGHSFERKGKKATAQAGG